MAGPRKPAASPDADDDETLRVVRAISEATREVVEGLETRITERFDGLDARVKGVENTLAHPPYHSQAELKKLALGVMLPPKKK